MSGDIIREALDNLRGYQAALSNGCEPMASRGQHFGAHLDAVIARADALVGEAAAKDKLIAARDEAIVALWGCMAECGLSLSDEVYAKIAALAGVSPAQPAEEQR